jgi:hypothetical protein
MTLGLTTENTESTEKGKNESATTGTTKNLEKTANHRGTETQRKAKNRF